VFLHSFWLTGRLKAGCPFNLILVDCLTVTSCMTACLIGWLAEWVTDRRTVHERLKVGYLIEWRSLVDCYGDKLTGWLPNLGTDKLAGWLTRTDCAEIFQCFVQSIQANSGVLPGFGHDHFLQNYPAIRRCILWQQTASWNKQPKSWSQSRSEEVLHLLGLELRSPSPAILTASDLLECGVALLDILAACCIMQSAQCWYAMRVTIHEGIWYRDVFVTMKHWRTAISVGDIFGCHGSYYGGGEQQQQQQRCGLSPRANYMDRATANCSPAFADRGCHVVSVTVPYGRILGFLDRSRYFFFQLAPQLCLRCWVDPFPDPLLLRKSGSARNRTLTCGYLVRNSDH
jgi:hypothetical protein